MSAAFSNIRMSEKLGFGTVCDNLYLPYPRLSVFPFKDHSHWCSSTSHRLRLASTSSSVPVVRNRTSVLWIWTLAAGVYTIPQSLMDLAKL